MRQAVGSIGFAGAAERYAARAAALVFAAFALGACSALDLFDGLRNDTRPDERAATFDPALAPPGPDDTGAAEPRDKPKAPKRAIAAAPPAKPKREPVQPETVVGMAEAEAERLFGPPHFVIRRQPSTRWHYVSERCTLDLFFFEDIETRERRILAYDVAAAEPGAAKTTDGKALNACVAAIHEERNGGSS